MLSINTNLSSLITQNSLTTSTDKLNQAIERMTTGLKINHSSDNAANYSISTNITTQMSAYMVAEENTSMAMDMVTTAEDTLSEIQDKFERMRMLQEQAINGTYGEQSLKAINSEVNALVDEIERLYSTAEYNGIKLFEEKSVEPTLEERFIVDFTRRDTTSMISLASITDETQILASGTYSISTPEELEKLARLSNTGKLCTMDPDDGTTTPLGTYEFVLANDIDLKNYSNWIPIGGIPVVDTNGDGVVNYDDDLLGLFTGAFDGNGYMISNMTITNGQYEGSGLFGAVAESEIKNLGVENVDIISHGGFNGAIAGMAMNLSINNCYTTGIIRVQVASYSAGILAMGHASTVSNSYSTIDFVLSGDNAAAYGIAVALSDSVMGDQIAPTNCFYAGKVSGVDVDKDHACVPICLYEQPLTDCYYINNWTTEENIEHMVNNVLGGDASVLGIPKTETELENLFGVNISRTKANSVDFQIGINSNKTSGIELELGFVLEELSSLRDIGLNKTADYLSIIDNSLKIVNTKQTEFGAVMNRLDSALEEISIKYENLASSRSTIRDADIAEVSSEYIKQQILQQASATLMATANQAPAIALQLI